ncbi:cytosine permease [Arthrobacter sp. AZCC_0090]|uniref:purine-cytosine permease family protein n=1 Tax=Arthrobacter sp. AZCC_0090 TaxID=2735881 RepID=UPI00161A97D4|nr:cytosine permease [Arthrobacter sp. AZCC_0090]MBB6406042.1 cytosine permease [Arthrobacter sp. AZCC_0090]
MSTSEIGHDDYPITRVPATKRKHWFGIAVQRFGQTSDLSQFLLGATFGFGMTFWDAFWAFTVGALIVEALMIFVGIAGMRQGLTTSMLARWTGFGRGGASVLGLTICISLIGWFGIQSGISGAGLNQIVPEIPTWAWSLAFGLVVTLIVVRGFESMQWLANITVPLFMILIAWAAWAELSNHSISQLINDAPPGANLDFVTATTIVAGSAVLGAVITPDMTRYNRTAGDVVKQTVVGITLGNYSIGMIGVLLAHAVKSADVTQIIFSSVGWVGILIIVLGTSKINDWNLYSAGLGVVSFFNSAMNKRLNRAHVTLLIGVVGTVLAAIGILDKFIDILLVLGVVFPPVAGIIMAEYFVVKKWRPLLEASRASGLPPVESPNWIPATFLIWAISAALGYFINFGLPAFNSLAAAFILYIVAGKLNLLRSYGDNQATNQTTTKEVPVTTP